MQFGLRRGTGHSHCHYEHNNNGNEHCNGQSEGERGLDGEPETLGLRLVCFLPRIVAAPAQQYTSSVNNISEPLSIEGPSMDTEVLIQLSQQNDGWLISGLGGSAARDVLEILKRAYGSRDDVSLSYDAALGTARVSGPGGYDILSHLEVDGGWRRVGSSPTLWKMFPDCPIEL